MAKPAEGAVSRSGEAEKPLLALWRCLAAWVGVSEHKGDDRVHGQLVASPLGQVRAGTAAFVAF